MTLAELSVEYERSYLRLAARIAELQAQLKETQDPAEARRLARRLYTLRTMSTETKTIALKLLDRAGVRFIGRYKTERWFKRTLKQASQNKAESVECIDRQKLLENVDAIWDCNDMVFEGGRDHSCHPEDCRGCHWADTKKYIQKLIESRFYQRSRGYERCAKKTEDGWEPEMRQISRYGPSV